MHRRTRGWGCSVLALALMAGALLPSASVAGHYHQVSGAAHGLKHGGATWDGSYFSRLDKPGLSYEVVCAVWHEDRLMDTDYRSGFVPTTCSAWSWRGESEPHFYRWRECQGSAALVSAETTFGGDVSEHEHRSHVVEEGRSCPSAIDILLLDLVAVP